MSEHKADILRCDPQDLELQIKGIWEVFTSRYPFGWSKYYGTTVDISSAQSGGKDEIPYLRFGYVFVFPGTTHSIQYLSAGIPLLRYPLKLLSRLPAIPSVRFLPAHFSIALSNAEPDRPGADICDP